MSAASGSERLLSLDVYRGAVILLLIPDTFGGFSLYAMAERRPEDAVWDLLAPMFRHVPWLGMSVWDLVMPAFVLAAGMATAYSTAGRRARGEPAAWIVAHGLLRGAALIVLHLALSLPVRSNIDYLWPLAVLVLGLRVPHRLAARAPALAWMNSRVAEVGWWLAVLALVSWRSVLRFDEIESFELYGLLPVLGLASAVAAPLATRSVRCQSGAAFALLLAYWLAFALYPLPWTESAAAGAATVVGGAAFSGFLAHWNPGTHVAAAFDIWLLNLFPRGEPYVPPAHGFHTLRFVAVAALLLFGMAIGQTLRNATSRERIRDRLFFAALAAISVALLLSLGIEPIVNRIWTSAWTLFSGGVVLILFLGAYSLIDLRGRRRYLAPLVVAGTNSLLLYVLALSVRWPVLEAWRRILGPRVFEGYWQPVLESLAFGLSLWAIAALLQRFRLFVRL